MPEEFEEAADVTSMKKPPGSDPQIAAGSQGAAFI